MKRFKNRLKAFDEAMKTMNDIKANVNELEDLRRSVDYSRIENVFSDIMKLVDNTKKSFDVKVEHERV